MGIRLDRDRGRRHVQAKFLSKIEWTRLGKIMISITLSADESYYRHPVNQIGKHGTCSNIYIQQSMINLAFK